MTEFKRDHFRFYQTSSRKLKPNLRNTWERNETYNKRNGYHSMPTSSWIKHIPMPVPSNVLSSLFNCMYGETGDQGNELVLPTGSEPVDIKEELIDEEGSEYAVPDRGARRRRKGGGLRKQRKRCPKEDPILSADSQFVLYEDLSDSDMGNGSRRRLFEKSNACEHIFETFSECYPIPYTIQCIPPTTLFNINDDFSCSSLLPQKGSWRRPFTNPNSSQGVAETSSSFAYPIEDDCSSPSMLPETSIYDYRENAITSRRIGHGDDRGRLPVIDEISTTERSSSSCLENSESKVLMKDSANLQGDHFDTCTETPVTQQVQSDTLETCRSSSSFRLSSYVSFTTVDELLLPNTASECDMTTTEQLCKTTALNDPKPESNTEDTACGKQSVTNLAEHNSSESNLAALKLVILHSIDFGNPVTEELNSNEGVENSERLIGASSVNQLMFPGCKKEPPVAANFGIDPDVNTGRGSYHNLKNEDEFHSAVDLKISEEMCVITGEKVQSIDPVSQYSSASACNPQGHCLHEPIKKQNISSSCMKESSTKETNRIQSEVQMHIPVDKSPNSKTKIVFASPVDTSKPLITERQDPAISSGAMQHLDRRPDVNIVKQTVSSVYYRNTKFIRLDTPLVCDQLPIGESRQSGSPKDGDWCRSIVQVQIALEPIPKSDSKAGLEVPPMLEPIPKSDSKVVLEAPPMLKNKGRCILLSKPADNTPGTKADLRDYLKQYCDNSDKEERIYVIVVPSRISIGHDSSQVNNTTRVVSDHFVDIESVLNDTPCKAEQLSLQSSEQTPDVPCASASLLTHRSHTTLIFPEDENSEIICNREETNVTKTTTCEVRKPRIHPDDVTRSCPPPVLVEDISDTETITPCTSQNLQNVDQCPELPNETDISTRMRDFKCRTDQCPELPNETDISTRMRDFKCRTDQCPELPNETDISTRMRDFKCRTDQCPELPNETDISTRMRDFKCRTDQCPELPNETDISSRMRDFKCRTEILKSKIIEAVNNKQSRGVTQMPPPPPRKDDRFYINESSTYRPGPWPAQAKPLESPLVSRVKKELIDVTAEVSEVEEELSKLQMYLEERKMLGGDKRELIITKNSVPSIQKKSRIKLETASKLSVVPRVASEIPPLFFEDLYERYNPQTRISAEVPVILKNTADSTVCSRPSSVQSPVRSRVASNLELELPGRSKIAEGLQTITRKSSRNVEEFPVCSRTMSTFIRPLGIAEEVPIKSITLSKIRQKIPDWSKALSRTADILPVEVRSRTPSITSGGKLVLSSRPKEALRVKPKPSKSFEEESQIPPTKLSKKEIDSMLESRTPLRIEKDSPPTSALSKSQIRPTRSFTMQLRRSKTHSKIDKVSLINAAPISTEEESAIGSRKPSRIILERKSSIITLELPVESKGLAMDKSPVKLRSGEFPFRSRKRPRIEEEITIKSKMPKCTEGSPVISRTSPLIAREIPARPGMPSRVREESLTSLRPQFRTEEEFPFMSLQSSWTEEAKPAKRRTSSTIFRELPVRSRSPARIEEGFPVTFRKPSEITKVFPVRSRTPSGLDEELPIRARMPSNVQEGSSIRLRLPSRTEEESSVNSRMSQWTEEAGPIWRRMSSTFANEIEEELPMRSRTPSRIGKVLPIRSRTQSRVEELPVRSRRSKSIVEEELPKRSRKPSRVQEEFPIRRRTSSRTEEVLPIRRRTPSIFEELPIWSRTQSRFEDDLPIRQRTSSGFEEELPMRRRTLLRAEEEIPIRPETPSIVKEGSTINRREPSRIGEELSFKAISPLGGEESPIRRRTSSKIREELPFRHRAASFEGVPLRVSISSRTAEESPVSPKRPSFREESFIRSRVPSKITEESPISPRTSSSVAVESLTRPTAASFEGVPLRVSVSSRTAEESPISPKRPSVREESFIRSRVPSRITEESPVNSRRPSSVAEGTPVSSKRSSKIEEDAEKPRGSTRLSLSVPLIDTDKEGGLTTEQWKELDRMIDRYDKWTDDVKTENDQHD